MKKFLLSIVLFPVLSIAQNEVELRLVDPNYGAAEYNFGMQMGNISNDWALNAILEQHQVGSYIGKYGILHQPYENSMIQINCACPNGLQAFLDDLTAYSEVVASAEVSQWDHFNNAVVAQINQNTGGLPTYDDGDGDGLPTTDPGLNAILESFNVYYYAPAFPSSGGDLARYHYSMCDCDETALYDALSAYEGIDAVEYMQAAYLLSNPEFSKPKTTVYPNPFSNTFSIETDAEIKSFTLFDNSGRQIVSSESQSKIDAMTSSLSSGFYALRLEFGNGQKQVVKLIKK